MDRGKPWPARREFFVEYRYVDALRHINHATYFGFMETLRCDYYLGITGETDLAKLDIIIAEASCRYLAPVQFGATLIGEVTPALPLGNSSFSLIYRFTDKSTAQVCARGRTVVVSYDYPHAQKKPIPSAMRDRLQSDAVPASSAGWA